MVCPITQGDHNQMLDTYEAGAEFYRHHSESIAPMIL